MGKEIYSAPELNVEYFGSDDPDTANESGTAGGGIALPDDDW